MNPDAFKEWERKRKKTITAFCVQTTLLGLDYSLLFLTLWAYLGQLKIETPSKYYGLIAVSYLLVAVIFSVPICKLADRYRNMRLLCFLTNIAMIIGNILYSFSFSPWFLIVGRIIAGCGIPLRSIMAGEVARVYQHDDLTSVFSMLGMSFGFGFVIGPGINFAFDHLDTYVGQWQISYANVSGLYVAVFFMVSQVFCYFMVFNVSKEYDLKAEIEEQNKKIKSEKKAIITNSFYFNASTRNNFESFRTITGACEVEPPEIITTNGSTFGGFEHLVNYSIDMSSTECSRKAYNFKDPGFISTDESTRLLPKIELTTTTTATSVDLLKLLQKMLSNKDTLLMLVLAFFENFFSISFNMWVPMAVLTTLHWSMFSLNAIVLGTGIFSIIPCLVLIFKKFSDRQMFWISTICVGFLACITCIYITLAFYKTTPVINIVLWALYDLLFSNIMIIKDIFLSGFLAKMLSSNIQSMGDSLRLSSQRLGAIAALLLSPTLYAYMKVVGFIYIGIVLILVCLMISRRKTLSNPKVVI